MRHLLDDLLVYSRVSLNLQIPVFPVGIDLTREFQEEIDLQQGAWPSHKIELSSEGDTCGVWDALRLKQVLGNLVSNAAKYGDEGVPILVRLQGLEDEIVISVENAGPTIPASDFNSLFEPLQRASTGSVETERNSMGLGLFIVQQIADAHRGTVGVTSENGRTAFSVVLPRNSSTRVGPTEKT